MDVSECLSAWSSSGLSRQLKPAMTFDRVQQLFPELLDRVVLGQLQQVHAGSGGGQPWRTDVDVRRAGFVHGEGVLRYLQYEE